MIGRSGPVAGPAASTATSTNARSGHARGPGVAPTVSTNRATSRITQGHLQALQSRLSDRDRTILEDLTRLRLIPSPALDVLHFPDIAATARARVRRRVMIRLARLGLVTTLPRRIGGVRAGSAGLIYTATDTGRRLITRHAGSGAARRRASIPGALFVAHTLAVTDLYTRLVRQGRMENFTVPTFTTEPDCWIPARPGVILRPDAYLVIDSGQHRDCWWLEIDRDTESVPRLRRKLRDYLDHLSHGGTGPDDVPPRILFTTPGQARADVITQAITRLSTLDTGWCMAMPHVDAPGYLATELAQ